MSEVWIVDGDAVVTGDGATGDIVCERPNSEYPESRALWIDRAALISRAPELRRVLSDFMGWFGGADPEDVIGNEILDRATALLAMASEAS